MIDPHDRSHPDFDHDLGFVPCRDDVCERIDTHPAHLITERRGRGRALTPEEREQRKQTRIRELHAKGGPCGCRHCTGREPSVIRTCPTCKGKGWLTNPCVGCPECLGRGKVRRVATW